MLSQLPMDLQNKVYESLDYKSICDEFYQNLELELIPDIYKFVYFKLHDFFKYREFKFLYPFDYRHIMLTLSDYTIKFIYISLERNDVIIGDNDDFDDIENEYKFINAFDVKFGWKFLVYESLNKFL